MLLPLAVLGAIPMGMTLGRGPVILTLAGAVLAMVIWVFWESLQNLTGDAPLTLEEAIGLGAPTAEEERKRSVLRILKDLEYERAVGKLSEEDFQSLSLKYRNEAKALLQSLDEHLGPAREKAEAKLRERLAEAPESASSAETQSDAHPSAGSSESASNEKPKS